MVRCWRVTLGWPRRSMGVGQRVFCPFCESYKSHKSFRGATRLCPMAVFLQFPQKLIRLVKS